MAKHHKLLTGFIAIAVICIVLTSGCVKEKGAAPSPTPAPSATPTPTITSPLAAGGLKTCADLNGYVCGVGEECPGKWLDASDTFSCCSEPCTSSTGAVGILTIEPFALIPENEELGDVT